MSVAAALRILAEKVPPVPLKKQEGETKNKKWDFQAGWWEGEPGPIRVTVIAKSGKRFAVLANNEAQAESIRMGMEVPPCP